MKLLDQLRREIRVRHYSIRTERSYSDWVRRFILFHNKRHPNEMGADEINRFLSHLASDRNVAAGTQNQALCAIVFFYKNVLKKEVGDLGELVRAKRLPKLPVVLTVEETEKILARITGTPRRNGAGSMFSRPANSPSIPAVVENNGTMCSKVCCKRP